MGLSKAQKDSTNGRNSGLGWTNESFIELLRCLTVAAVTRFEERGSRGRVKANSLRRDLPIPKVYFKELHTSRALIEAGQTDPSLLAPRKSEC